MLHNARTENRARCVEHLQGMRLFTTDALKDVRALFLLKNFLSI